MARPRRASVVVVTKDRHESLRVALRSAVAQEGGHEVLVLDDGSRDGTAAMVAAEFPTVRVHRFERAAGLVVRRNQAAALATGDVLLSIDDDAELPSPRIVEQTLADFDDERIGAVAVPYVDVRHGPAVLQAAPDADGRWACATFRGTAYAVRRDAFNALGGFRELIFHQGEEVDFTLRMLDAGRAVRLGRADPILHHESPSRDLRRMAHYGRRNEVLLAATRFPAPWHLLVPVVQVARGLLLGRRLGVLPESLRGARAGTALAWSRWPERHPVSRRTFRLERRLRRRGALPLDEVLPRCDAPGQVPM